MKEEVGETKPQKECDHTSVGILVWQGDKLLLIERKKFPFGFAPPAGHLDGDTDFEMAGRRELKEEVGIETADLQLVAEGKKENPCRRPGGTWHDWKIYEVKLTAPAIIKRSPDETKQAGWYLREQMKKLAERTKQYLAGKISESEWEQSPGIEPVWSEWFQKLAII